MHIFDNVNKKNIVILCISVMAESKIKSREAKVDFGEDVLGGKKEKL